jgi:hypothetical protein
VAELNSFGTVIAAQSDVGISLALDRQQVELSGEVTSR